MKNRYNGKAYDRLAITIPKGSKPLIEKAADPQSVNAYVNAAILEKMELKEWPKSSTRGDEKDP